MKYNYTATDYLNKSLDGDRMVNRFLDRYESHAGPSHKLYAKRQVVAYRDWLADGGPIPFHQDVEREPYVEMYIPQHRFRQLVELDQDYDDLCRQASNSNAVIAQMREEEHIRNSNPSVKAAYEKYKMLLEICR